MKLIIISCVLALACSVELDGLGSGQNFERTPNNNLVQVTYAGAQGGGVYGNRQNYNSQRYGYNNQNNNQYRNQVSSNNRNQLFNNAVSNNQNQRYSSFNRNQFNNQNQRFNQLNQQNQRFNQIGQNSVDVSFRNNRNQQFLQNQVRQGHNIDFSFSNNGNQQLRQNQDRQGHNLEFSSDNHRNQQFLQNQETQGQVSYNQERPGDHGRGIIPCHSTVNDWYVDCISNKCTGLFWAWADCRISAKAARDRACWNSATTAPATPDCP